MPKLSSLSVESSSRGRVIPHSMEGYDHAIIITKDGFLKGMFFHDQPPEGKEIE